MRRSINDSAPAFTAATSSAVAARAAVMEIPLYPDLSVRLKKALGYGPHVDILQHLAYWFHPRHPKMQDRWTLYKTFDEWYEECGLTDRQVKKGRKELHKAGLLTWKRGQYGRVHYHINWPELADILNPDTVGVPIEDFDDDFEDFNPDGVGVPIQSGHQGVPFNPDGVGVPFNPDGLASDPIQETTQEVSSGGYPQKSSLLQSGPESHSRSGPREINNDFQDLEEQLSAQPSGDKRHSQDRDTQHEEQAAKDEVDEPPFAEEAEPPAPPEPEDAELLAEVREVLDPKSGKWSPVYAESIRAKYGGPGYTAERVAGYLANDPDLPYQGRRAELEPCVRYVFWEWAHERQAREVAA